MTLELTRPDQKRAALATTGDFLSYQDLLDKEEQDLLDSWRGVFERSVKPVVASHWDNGTFPFEILPALAAARTRLRKELFRMPI